MFTTIHCISKVLAANNFPLDNDLSRMELTPDDFPSEIPQSSSECKRIGKANRRRAQQLQKPQQEIVVLETNAGEKFEVDLNAPESLLIAQMKEISKTLPSVQHNHFDLEMINLYINADPLAELYLPQATMDEVRAIINKIPHQHVRPEEHFTYTKLLKKKKVFVQFYGSNEFRNTSIGKLFRKVEDAQKQIRNREQFAKEFFEDFENPNIREYVEYFNGFFEMVMAFEPELSIFCPGVSLKNISSVYAELREFVVDNEITSEDSLVYLYKIAKPYEAGRHDQEIKKFKQQIRSMKNVNNEIEKMLNELRQG